MNNPLQLIPELLSFIPADLSRDRWLNVLMSIKATLGEAGRDIANEWSRTGSNYQPRAFRDTWVSLKESGGVTMGTLIHIAKDYGFRFQDGTTQTPKHIQHFIQEAKAKARERAKQEATEKKINQFKAAEEAVKLWKQGGMPNPAHPYLVNKHLSEVEGIGQTGNDLLIPLIDVQGKLWNIQKITPEGGKYFLPKARVKGCFCLLGQLKHSLIMCEGFATGMTLRILTKETVICAMNAGNLIEVAKELQKSHPTLKVTIAADNDRHNVVNTGRIKALEAAKHKSYCTVWLPEFKEGETGKDFNDLAIQRGTL
jgi:putative DNA primase/helicase